MDALGPCNCPCAVFCWTCCAHVSSSSICIGGIYFLVFQPRQCYVSCSWARSIIACSACGGFFCCVSHVVLALFFLRNENNALKTLSRTPIPSPPRLPEPPRVRGREGNLGRRGGHVAEVSAAENPTNGPPQVRGGFL